MMTKLIAWLFILMCPFVGGNLVAIAGLGRLLDFDWHPWYIASIVVWMLLWAAWFDDSKWQRALTD